MVGLELKTAYHKRSKRKLYRQATAKKKKPRKKAKAGDREAGARGSR
jgi:hypothetical protein